MAFDPDAYLAKKTAFDPDAYLRAKGAVTAPAAGPSTAEAAIRGAGQGATLGFGDELAAGTEAVLQKILPENLGGIDYGKSLPKLYRENRDAFRRENKAAQDAHPVAYFAGNVAGGAPMAVATGGGAAKTATTSAKLLRAALTGAGFGAAGAAGDSTAEDAAGIAKDAALGGTIGAALPVVGGAALRALPRAAEALDKFAVKAGRKVLSNVTNSLSSKVPLSPEAVREAEAGGVFKLFGTSEGAAQRLEALRENVGQQYANIIKALEAKGITGPDAQTLAQKYLAEAATAEATSMNPTVARTYANAADQLANKPAPGGRLPLSLTEDLKRSLQDQARSAYQKMEPGEVGRASESAASIMRQAVEDEIAQQAAASNDPVTQAIASQFKPVKQRLGNLIEASNVAREGMNRAARRSPFGMTEMLGATGALAHSGNPVLAAAAGVGAHLLKTRGPSTAVVLSRAGADALDAVASPRVQYLLEMLRRPATPLLAEQAGEGVAQ